MGGEGNLVIENVADAKFVDVSQNNYRIKNDSPAIDAGVKVNEVTKDMDGEQRPTNGLYDVGADEYSTTLSLQDFDLNKVQLSPNPVKNLMYYSVKNNTSINNFYLIDVNGRKVYQVNYFHQNYIDLSAIPAGLYFGYFTLNSKLIVKKIIKQ